MEQRNDLLVVEDSPLLRQKLVAVLGAEGYSLRTAVNGEQALVLFAAQPPDLVLLDICLPGIDGLEVCRRIKNLPKHSDVPIIFLSGLSEVAQRVEGLRLGAVDYICKPFEPEELLVRIRAHLELQHTKRLLESQKAELLIANVKLAEDDDWRRRIEAELIGINNDARISGENFRAIFEGATEGMLVADADTHRFILANPRIEEILGYSTGELTGKSVEDIHPKESLPSVLAEFDALVRGVETLAIGLPCLRKDDMVIYADIATAPITLNGRVCAVGRFTDVTKRIQTERALRESEAKYRTVVENIQEGILVFSEGRKKFANRRYLEILGYAEEEFERLEFMASIHPEDQQTARNKITELMRTRTQGGNFSFRVIHKSGLIRWLSGKASFIQWEGKPSAIVFVEDITEARQLEEHLELLKHSVDVHFDGAYWMDAENRLIYINESGCKAVGYSQEELIGQHISLISPRATPKLMEQVWERLRTDGFRTSETTHRRKDGTEFPVEIVSSYVRHDGREYTCGFARDITQRKLAELAVREGEAHYRTLFNAIPDAIFILGPKGRFLDANQKAIERYGYSHGELLEMTVSDLAADDLKGKAPERVQQAVEGTLGRLDWRHRTKDGCEIPVEIVTKPVTLDGQIRMIATVRDVTDRKVAQDALLRATREWEDTFETIPDAITIHDLDYNILRANKAAIKLLGLDHADEPEAWKCYRAFHDLSSSASGCPSCRCMADGNPTTLEFYEPNLDRYVEVTALPRLNNLGQMIGIIHVCRDISERFRAEEALRKSEASLEEAQRIAQIGSWEWDMVSNTVQWSKEMFRVFDFDPETFDYTSESILKVIHPDDVEYYSNNMATTFTNGRSPSLEYRVIHKDGSVHDIHAEGRVEFDQAGKPIFSFGTAQDITARKHIETALKESEGHVRAKLEAILQPEGDIGTLALRDIIDVAGVQSLMDDYYKLSGIPVAIIDLQGEVLVGTGWQDICIQFHRVNPDTFNACIECDTVLTLGVPFGSYKTYLCKNGLWDVVTPIYVGGKHVGNIFTGQFFYEDTQPDREAFIARSRKYGFDEAEYLAALGRVPRFSREKIASAMSFYMQFAQMISVLSYSNIMLARSAEALHRSEASLTKAQQVAHVGSWAWHIQSNRLEWSDEMYRIFGIEKASFTGDLTEVVQRFIHTDDRAKVTESNMLVIKENMPIPLEYRTIWPDGTIRTVWAEAGELILDDSGKPTILTGIVQDITERKRAEEAIRHSEERLSDIIFSMGDWVWETDANGIYTYSSNKGMELFGPAIGKTPFDFMPLDEAVRIRAVFSELSANKLPIGDLENWNLTEAGERVCLLTNGVPILDDKGNLIGYRGVDKDITERKKIEEALRASEERFYDLFEKAPLGYQSLDEQGCFLEVNQAWLETLGYSRDEVIGKWFGDFLAPEFKDAFRQSFPIFRQAGRIHSEFQMLRKSGERRFISFEGRIAFQADGTFKQTHCILEDITERRKVEEALEDASQFNQQVIHGAREGIIVYSSNLRYLVWNPYMEQMSGLEAEEVIGKLPWEVFPFLREAGIIERLKRALEGEESDTLDFEYQVSATGKTGWASDKNAPLRNTKGEIIGVIGTVRDITDKKRAEEAIISSREELRALAGNLQTIREEERTHIAREIHDVLAQDLTRLKIDLVWLKGKLLKPAETHPPTKLVPRVEEMAQIANSAIQSVQKIATELRPPVLDSLGLAAAIEWQSHDFQDHTGIQCEVSVPEESLSSDRDTSSAIFRILQESLTNVIRHAKATKVTVTLRQEYDRLHLTVHDNGHGIEKKALFSPTSLGLVGMRERALLLNGQFEITSQPSFGTTIDVRVPLMKNTQSRES